MPTTLPVELWTQILAWLRKASDSSLGIALWPSPNRDDNVDGAFEALRTCCLVSRTFRETARPFLFEIMRLGDLAHASTSTTDIRMFLQWLISLINSEPKVAHWIKDVRVVVRRRFDLPNKDRSNWREELNGMTNCILLRLPNIYRASFENYGLTREVYSHLCRSTHMVELRLTGVLFVNIYSPLSLPIDRPQLLFLELDGVLPTEAQIQLLRPAVQHLAFGPCLERLLIRNSLVNPILFDLDKLHAEDLSGLHELALRYPLGSPLAPLFELFSRCFALTTLDFHLSEGYDGQPVDIMIAGDLFPQLRTFWGDHVLANHCILGRPVQTIGLDIRPPGGGTVIVDKNFLESVLSSTTVPLRELHLRLSTGVQWAAAAIKDMSVLLPELESLKVFLNGQSVEMKLISLAGDFPDDLKALPKLIKFAFGDLSRNRRLVTSLSEEEEDADRVLLARVAGVCPNLMEMSRRPGAQWKRNDQGEWAVTYGQIARDHGPR